MDELTQEVGPTLALYWKERECSVTAEWSATTRQFLEISEEKSLNKKTFSGDSRLE